MTIRLALSIVLNILDYRICARKVKFSPLPPIKHNGNFPICFPIEAGLKLTKVVSRFLTRDFL